MEEDLEMKNGYLFMLPLIYLPMSLFCAMRHESHTMFFSFAFSLAKIGLAFFVAVFHEYENASYQ
jgi:hypothetical protein